VIVVKANHIDLLVYSFEGKKIEERGKAFFEEGGFSEASTHFI